jgi:hypothetical protein
MREAVAHARLCSKVDDAVKLMIFKTLLDGVFGREIGADRGLIAAKRREFV